MLALEKGVPQTLTNNFPLIHTRTLTAVCLKNSLICKLYLQYFNPRVAIRYSVSLQIYLYNVLSLFYTNMHNKYRVVF